MSMQDIKQISYNNLLNISKKDIEGKAIIVTKGSMVQIIDLPEHGSAEIVMTDRRFSRVNYKISKQINRQI